jgi:trigger factor
MEKMAPGNDLVYTAEIALMPGITKLADYNQPVLKPEGIEVSDELMQQATQDLLRMRTNEVRAKSDHTLQSGDKAVVSLGMKRRGVVLEGGEAQNHGIYTAEKYYVDGFIDKILGAKEGEERAFTLKFPKDHYQKHLAGEDVDFTVKLKEIYTLETPKLDEAFVASLGFKSLDHYNEQLKLNLGEEKRSQEEKRQEKAVLEYLAEKSSFTDIGDLLVNQEIDKMIFELRQWVTQNGMEFDEYLKSINKSTADLKLDFAAQALVRIKVALILEAVAKQENIAPEASAVDAELDRIAEGVGKEPTIRERIYSPEYRERIETQLRNKQTVDFLRKKMVG